MITPSFGLTATERVLPKLALDFTTASLDSRITFTRNTNASNPATYVSSNGYVTEATNDQPRFDYDPVTLGCKGLLIEESRQNKCLHSSDFSNAAWTKVGSGITANQMTAPNNLTDADLFTEDASTGRHFVGITSAVSITGAISVSCFVKKKDRRYIQLCVPTAASDSFSALFDLDSVSVTDNRVSNATHTQTYTGATITAAGNGWYRLTLSGTTTAPTAFFNIGQSNTGSFAGATISFNMISYTGDNTSGTYVWGAQLEAGAFPTSYIPTTTTALTRNADVATMTGTNFSDWYNASEGAFAVTATRKSAPTAGKFPYSLFLVSTSGNDINLYQNGATSEQGLIRVSNATQANLNSTAISANTQFTQCVAYKLNSFAQSVNAGTRALDASGAVPTVNSMYIGGINVVGYELNGWVRKLNYWPQRLIDNEVTAFSK